MLSTKSKAMNPTDSLQKYYVFLYKFHIKHVL
jgi:hypothetical protein